MARKKKMNFNPLKMWEVYTLSIIGGLYNWLRDFCIPFMGGACPPQPSNIEQFFMFLIGFIAGGLIAYAIKMFFQYVRKKK